MMPTDTIGKLIQEAIDWLSKWTDFSLFTAKQEKTGLEEEKCTPEN